MRRNQSFLIAAAIGFLVLYLCVDFVTPNLASSSLPLPNAPAAEARDWFADNPLATVAMGVVQLLSVACLAAFVLLLRRTKATPWGLVSVAAMVVSSVTSFVLAALAPSASLDTVAVLRSVSFISGGTAHVATLGVFILIASRTFSKPVRVFGIVAAVPAIASLVSLVWFNGAVLILLGRLLCMVWTIAAAVSLFRGAREHR
jgi:hypothetical protein